MYRSHAENWESVFNISALPDSANSCNQKRSPKEQGCLAAFPCLHVEASRGKTPNIPLLQQGRLGRWVYSKIQQSWFELHFFAFLFVFLEFCSVHTIPYIKFTLHSKMANICNSLLWAEGRFEKWLMLIVRTPWVFRLCFSKRTRTTSILANNPTSKIRTKHFIYGHKNENKNIIQRANANFIVVLIVLFWNIQKMPLPITKPKTVEPWTWRLQKDKWKKERIIIQRANANAGA